VTKAGKRKIPSWALNGFASWLVCKLHRVRIASWSGAVCSYTVAGVETMSVDGTHHYGVQIDLAALPNEPDVLQQMLREVVPEPYAENHKLWLLIQRRLRHRYGPRSEKLNLDQLQLVLVDAEQSAAEAGAATDAAAPPVRRRRAVPAHRNRGALPAHLPRYELVIDIETKDCPCCGGTLHVIGEDRSEHLDLVPAQLRGRSANECRYASG
jgi:transposase